MLPHAAFSHRHRPQWSSLLVCVAGLLRGGALIRGQASDDQGPAPDAIAALREALVANSSDLQTQLADAGIVRVDRLRFDRSAAVILTYGADNEPGQAGDGRQSRHDHRQLPRRSEPWAATTNVSPPGICRTLRQVNKMAPSRSAGAPSCRSTMIPGLSTTIASYCTVEVVAQIGHGWLITTKWFEEISRGSDW